MRAPVLAIGLGKMSPKGGSSDEDDSREKFDAFFDAVKGGDKDAAYDAWCALNGHGDDEEDEEGEGQKGY